MSDSSFGYKNSVRQVLAGDNAQPAQAAARLRDANGYEALVRQQLITWRIALKHGFEQINTSSVDPNRIEDRELRAEVLFLRAKVHLHLKDYASAMRDFTDAGLLYRSLSNFEYYLRSLFNAHIAFSFTNPSENAEQASLERVLSEAENFRHEPGARIIFGLVYRQRSYRLWEKAKYNAALFDAKRAVHLLGAGPSSDRHLALVHLADCYACLGKRDCAERTLEYLPADIDDRVRFPKAYVSARLRSRADLDLTAFQVVNDHWRGRYAGLSRDLGGAQAPNAHLVWDVTTSQLLDGVVAIGRIKVASLEGRLLQQLMRVPAPKQVLIEALWPEVAAREALDDRFHRLLSRLNGKLGSLIVYDGLLYRLRRPIRASGT